MALLGGGHRITSELGQRLTVRSDYHNSGAHIRRYDPGGRSTRSGDVCAGKLSSLTASGLNVDRSRPRTQVLLRKRARKLSDETGNVYVSMYDVNLKANETLAHKLKVQLTRPFILLFTETIVGLLGIYAAIICKSRCT